MPTIKHDYATARPILKWAGGKGQLLPQLNSHLPEKLKVGTIKRYIEPFVGGGALFFDLIGNYDFEDIFLFDVNPELAILYNTVKDNVDDLICELEVLQNQYFSINEQAKFYYERRDEYNSFKKSLLTNTHSSSFVRRSALTIFLNRTCFNGLFRVNSKNQFNVPMGNYKSPRILDEENLRNVSNILQRAVIAQADFSSALKYANKDTFIYYDPPYRPIKETSSFNSYSVGDFGDDEQIRLCDIFAKAHHKGAMQMLSNSDPTNYSADPFFDDLYKGFYIRRIMARRLINSKANGRSEIRELLITNY